MLTSVSTRPLPESGPIRGTLGYRRAHAGESFLTAQEWATREAAEKTLRATSTGCQCCAPMIFLNGGGRMWLPEEFE